MAGTLKHYGFKFVANGQFQSKLRSYFVSHKHTSLLQIVYITKS